MRHKILLIFLVVILLHNESALLLWGQQLPPAPATTPTSIDPLIQRQFDQLIENIRKEFVAANYREVMRLCEQADALIPNHPSTRLYREWSLQKLSATKIREHADVDFSEESQTPSAPPPVVQVTPVSAAETPQSAAAAPAQRQPVLPSDAPAPSRISALGVVLFVIVALLGAAVGAMILVALRRRSAGVAPVSSADEKREKAEVAPAKEVLAGEAVPETPSAGLVKEAEGKPFATPTPGLGLPTFQFGGVTTFQGNQVQEAEPTSSGSGLSPTAEAPVSPMSSGLGSAESVAEAFAPQAPEREIPQEKISAALDLAGAEPPSTPSIVSFEELGIALPTEPEPQPEPPRKTYEASLEGSRIIISPVGQSASAPAPPESKSEKLEAVSAGQEITLGGSTEPSDIPALSLEDIIATNLPPAAQPEPPQPSPLFSKSEKPISASSPLSEGGALDAVSLDFGEGELDELSQLTSEVSPPATADLETVTLATGSAKTPQPESGSELEETKTLSVASETGLDLEAALAETKVMEAVSSSTPAPTSTTEHGAEPDVLSAKKEESAVAGDAAQESPPEERQSEPSQKVLDERSERMFRDQYERGLKALETKNYKQAVYYLSIAAAIHPENSEVREMLRQARELKRQQDGGY